MPRSFSSRQIRRRTRLLIGYIVFLGVVRLGVVAPAPAQPAAEPDLKALETYVETAMDAGEVPGLSIAIAERDSVVWARGFGVRAEDKSTPVDGESLFAIGSCSKAFAAASVATLVSDGTLDWNDRVTEYLPWLELWDPWVTDHILVRDLLTHRVGTAYPIENRMRPLAEDRRDFLERYRWVEPIAPFREQYVYSNTMFIVAGELVRTVSGAESWEAFAHDRLWEPLGMDATNASIDAARSRSNRAMPHREVDGELRAVPWEYPDSIAVPSGGINSTAEDMAQWLRFHLNEGRFEGRRLVDEEVFEVLHTPHTAIRPQDVETWPGELVGEMVGNEALNSNSWAYGMGWVVMEYRDRTVAWHVGGASGFSCTAAVVPQEGVGVYVGESRGTRVDQAVLFRALDAYLGGPEVDWSAHWLEEHRQSEAEARRQEKKLQERREEGTEPSLSLDGYSGTYVNDQGFGTLEILRTDDGLDLRLGHLEGTLEHWHQDVFRGQLWWESGPYGDPRFVTFTIGPKQTVQAVEVEGMARFEQKADDSSEAP